MDPKKVFAGIPNSLHSELLSAHNEIVRNFRESRWEPSELNGGKLCEIVYTIIRGYVDGKYPPRAKKPRNMYDACLAMEKADSSIFPRSVRILIPRVLTSLYEVRNNRGVGHVGGEVDSNEMDAKFVLESSKWLVAELVRIFYDVGVQDAQQVVDRLVERTIPIVWDGGSTKRVLNAKLSRSDQSLLMLYSSKAPLLDSILCDWIEHPNLPNYRRDVLRPLHGRRLIEFDENTKLVELLPPGVAYVEDSLPLTL